MLQVVEFLLYANSSSFGGIEGQYTIGLEGLDFSISNPDFICFKTNVTLFVTLYFFYIIKNISCILWEEIFQTDSPTFQFYGGALAREARAAAHHG